MSRIPLIEIPEPLDAHIKALGAKPLNLYRALSHNPRLLNSWLDFAYTLRDGKTPRRLRELMILRTAQMTNSAYELAQHRIMAKKAGVEEQEIAELEHWQQSTLFSHTEKAALKLTEAIVNNNMTDDIYENMAQHFSHEEIIELLLTASFYCMVPRFLNAIAITTEGE